MLEQEFKELACVWSRISSPHIIKLYGLTLTVPYTMVMEHCKFGPLNEFLRHNKSKVSRRQLIDVVHGLVRGLVYLVSSLYSIRFTNLKETVSNISSVFIVQIFAFISSNNTV